jgi:hypothetical protein
LVAYSGLATSVRQSNENDQARTYYQAGQKAAADDCDPGGSFNGQPEAHAADGLLSKKETRKGFGQSASSATARKLLTIVFVTLKKELDNWYLEDRLYNRKLRLLNAAA